MNKFNVQTKNNLSKLHHHTLLTVQSLELCPNSRSSDPGAMKFKLLKEALFFIITMHLIYRIITQEQRIFLKYYWIHIELRPNKRTPDPVTMKFTIIDDAFFLIITLYLVYGLNTDIRNFALNWFRWGIPGNNGLDWTSKQNQMLYKSKI